MNSSLSMHDAYWWHHDDALASFAISIRVGHVQRILWEFRRLEDLLRRLPQLCMRRLEGRTHLLLDHFIKDVSAPRALCRVACLAIAALRDLCHIVQCPVVGEVTQESGDELERFFDLFSRLSRLRDVFLVPRLHGKRVEVVAENLDVRLCERVKVRLCPRIVLVVALALVGQANNGPSSLVRVDVHHMVFVGHSCDVEKVFVGFIQDKPLFDVDRLRRLNAFECILRAFTSGVVALI